MSTIAIMQPTYLPWIGYFGMIDRVDTFVFLDSVQFARRSWQQRNRIKTSDGPLMLTVPVHKKGARDQIIAQVRIDEQAGFADKHVRAIEHALRKAPHFEAHAAELFSVLRSGHERLADLNIALIAWVAETMGVRCRFVRSSQLDTEGAKAELLACICHTMEADVYLSAPGSRDYLEGSDAFERRGIAVRYHDYEHPSYPQLHGPFEPYMSVVDLLFNVGPQSLETIRSGYVSELPAAS